MQNFHFCTVFGAVRTKAFRGFEVAILKLDLIGVLFGCLEFDSCRIPPFFSHCGKPREAQEQFGGSGPRIRCQVLLRRLPTVRVQGLGFGARVLQGLGFRVWRCRIWGCVFGVLSFGRVAADLRARIRPRKSGKLNVSFSIQN